MAERSPGFVWRLQGPSGNATDLHVGDDPLVIVNLTVWDTADDLFAFTYRSDHRSVFARRFEWFERREGPSVALWWQPTGTIPTMKRLFAASNSLPMMARHPRCSPSSSGSRPPPDYRATSTRPHRNDPRSGSFASNRDWRGLKTTSIVSQHLTLSRLDTHMLTDQPTPSRSRHPDEGVTPHGRAGRVAPRRTTKGRPTIDTLVSYAAGGLRVPWCVRARRRGQGSDPPHPRDRWGPARTRRLRERSDGKGVGLSRSPLPAGSSNWHGPDQG